MLAKEGIPAAQKLFESIKKDTLRYYLSEDEMNSRGYQLMGNNLNEQALEVLKTIVAQFPEGWNAYDSYGEILLKLGRKEEAKKMYQRSVELNPRNEGGKKVLEQLERKQ